MNGVLVAAVGALTARDVTVAAVWFVAGASTCALFFGMWRRYTRLTAV